MLFATPFRLLNAARGLSTSASLQYPKLKSHQGAKKRWRALVNGQFKRAHAGHSHLNEYKPPARKNRLAQATYSNPTQKAKLHKLLPYGS